MGTVLGTFCTMGRCETCFLWAAACHGGVILTDSLVRTVPTLTNNSLSLKNDKLYKLLLPLFLIRILHNENINKIHSLHPLSQIKYKIKYYFILYFINNIFALNFLNVYYLYVKKNVI